jgi:AraC-like DNA-binding protein
MGAMGPNEVLRSQLVGPVLSYLRERGLDTSPLVRAYRLPDTVEADPEVLLPLGAFYTFLDEAERLADDPFLGLHIAQSCPQGRYGVVEFAARSAPTMRGALGRVVRYFGLLNELVITSLEDAGGETVFRHRVPGRPLATGRHANEFCVTLMHFEARSMLEGWRLERAFFAHPAPRDVGPLVEALGTHRLSFGREESGFVVSSRLLELPLAGANPPLLAVLDQAAERLLRDRPEGPGLAAQVRHAVRNALPAGECGLGPVARALRVSPRTLQRRLSDEGVNFNDLVDDVREELARTLVREGRRPLGEISFLLGYAELSTFLRAFKRWTGTTPSRFRARP